MYLLSDDPDEAVLFLLSEIARWQDRAERAEKFCRIFGEHRDKLTGSPRIRDWFFSRDSVFTAYGEWKDRVGDDR